VNVVWIMMVVSTHSWVAPTMEFNSKEKCETALVSMQQQVRTKTNNPRLFDGFCVRIEK
jgi:hypothetical protein